MTTARWLAGIGALLLVGAASGCSDLLRPEDVTLAILAPRSGDSLRYGDTVTLEARLTGPGGRDLTGVPVRWALSTGQALGTGLTLRALPADTGSHDLIVTADLDGGPAIAKVAIVIWTLRPADVTLTILSPAPGDSMLAGDSVTLAARLTDLRGRDLPEVPISWATSLGGSLGDGVTLRTALRDPGTYEVRARADLGYGGVAEAGVGVTVGPNSPPRLTTVRIPKRAYVSDSLPLVARASDDESPTVRVLWYDGETLVGEGDSIVWVPGPPVGNRTIRVRAVDPQGYPRDSTVVVRALSDAHLLWVTSGGLWNPLRELGSSSGNMLARADNGDLIAGFYGISTSSQVYVFASDGRLRWQTTLDNQFWDHSSGLTLAPDGSIFVFDFRGMGYRFSADGAQVWKQQLLAQDPHGRFALDPAGRLYAAGDGLPGSGLVRVDPLDGTTIWSRSISSSGTYRSGPAVLPDSTVTAQGFISLVGSVMFRVDPDGNPVVDSAAAPSGQYMSAADARGFTYISSTANVLAAVDPALTVQWQVAFPTRPGEAVIAGDSTVYSGAYVEWGPDGTTEVKGITPGGTVRWTRSVAGVSYIPRFAVLADGTLWVATGVYLHRLSRANGGVVSSIEFPSIIESSLAVAPDGTLYLSTLDGRLHAVKGGAALDPAAPWPIWRRDNRRTASVPRP